MFRVGENRIHEQTWAGSIPSGSERVGGGAGRGGSASTFFGAGRVFTQPLLGLFGENTLPSDPKNIDTLPPPRPVHSPLGV